MFKAYRNGLCSQCNKKATIVVKKILCARCNEGNKKLAKANRPPKFTPVTQSKPSIKELRKLLIPKNSSNVIPKLIAELTEIFNAYIRKRDSKDGLFFCISCGKEKPVSEMQAGHFWPTTYSYLRFNEDNVNGECMDDNIHNPDHLIGYHKGLIKKCGKASFQKLEEDRHRKQKWTAYELKEMIYLYKNKNLSLSC